MVVRGAKGGEGMGRAAVADVLGGWEGMVPASFHAPAARALSGPSPLSRREESRSGGRLLLLRHIEDVLRTKKEKETVCSCWVRCQQEQTA